MNKIYQKTLPAGKNAGFTLIELLVVVFDYRYSGSRCAAAIRNNGMESTVCFLYAAG